MKPADPANPTCDLLPKVTNILRTGLSLNPNRKGNGRKGEKQSRGLCLGPSDLVCSSMNEWGAGINCLHLSIHQINPHTVHTQPFQADKGSEIALSGPIHLSTSKVQIPQPHKRSAFEFEDASQDFTSDVRSLSYLQ